MGERTHHLLGWYARDLADPRLQQAHSDADVDIHEIRLLKERYINCLNDKDWRGLVDILAEDATVSYEDGKTNYRGRDAIIDYLRNGLETLSAFHTATNGVIALDGQEHAHGIWDLRFTWDDPWDNTSMRGRGVYSDRYVKLNGNWMIEFSGFATTQD